MPNFSLLWMKLSQWQWYWLLWLSRTSFQDPVASHGLAPGNLCSLIPSQASPPHHPSPETLLPHLITQMSHYQKDLPRPRYLKYTFPCHSLSPLCWVIFLHSSNVMFNVSLSVVCLSLLHEDWDFICVVSMYLAHGRPSTNICWVTWWALCQGLGSLSGSFHEPFTFHLGPLLRAAQVFGMHQDP